MNTMMNSLTDPTHQQLAELIGMAPAVMGCCLTLLLAAEKRREIVATITTALIRLGAALALPGLWLWEMLTHGTATAQASRAMVVEAGLIKSRQINAKRAQAEAQAEAEAKLQMVRSMLAQMEADIAKDLAQPDPTATMREGWINTGSGWVQMDPTDCPEPPLFLRQA